MTSQPGSEDKMNIIIKPQVRRDHREYNNKKYTEAKQEKMKHMQGFCLPNKERN